MSVTWQDIINRALLDLGEIQPGEAPSSTESDNGFIKLVEIFDSWSLEGITAYTQNTANFTLSAGVTGYTMGPNGTWATSVRPVKLKGAQITYQGLQQGVAVMPMAAFQASLAFGEKPAPVEYLTNGQPASPVLAAWAAAALPTKLGEDSGAPLKNIRVHPVPTVGATIDVSFFTPLPVPVSLATTLPAWPAPGYEAAIVTELAVVLAPSYGRPVPPELLANMQRFKGRINEINGQIEIGAAQGQ